MAKIKWKQSDYIKLGRAISEYNKKVSRLQEIEERTYLPSLIDYKEAKSSILSRKELNRMIASLKRFNKEGAEDLYVTKGGFMLSKWEHKELQREQKIREKKLTEELNKLKEPSKYSNVGASKYEMRKCKSKRDRDNVNANKLRDVRANRRLNKVYGT